MIDDMNLMFDDVKNFFDTKTEDKYKINGKPYKRGYLIYGQSGTGKTTITEKIAIDYNMSIYIINLNSNDMTDSF